MDDLQENWSQFSRSIRTVCAWLAKETGYSPESKFPAAKKHYCGHDYEQEIGFLMAWLLFHTSAIEACSTKVVSINQLGVACYVSRISGAHTTACHNFTGCIPDRFVSLYLPGTAAGTEKHETIKRLS
jgi:hypothetical protein